MLFLMLLLTVIGILTSVGMHAMQSRLRRDDDTLQLKGRSRVAISRNYS